MVGLHWPDRFAATQPVETIHVRRNGWAESIATCGADLTRRREVTEADPLTVPICRDCAADVAYTSKPSRAKAAELFAWLAERRAAREEERARQFRDSRTPQSR